MKIKWYWLAERMGLVRDVSALYDDGTTYQVSAKADEIFGAIELALIPLLFLLGFALCFFSSSRAPLRVGVGLLLGYALLLAVGMGPYVEFYPRGGGFFDFAVLEHIFLGLGCALLALVFWLGGRLGRRLRQKKLNQIINNKENFS